jgi:fumarylacetoacetase
VLAAPAEALQPAALLTVALNETHDPTLRSWVGSANAPGADFPIQNLPFGVIRGSAGAPNRAAIRLGWAFTDWLTYKPLNQG